MHAGAGMHVWCIYESVNVNSCARGANVYGMCRCMARTTPISFGSPPMDIHPAQPHSTYNKRGTDGKQKLLSCPY